MTTLLLRSVPPSAGLHIRRKYGLSQGGAREGSPGGSPEGAARGFAGPAKGASARFPFASFGIREQASGGLSAIVRFVTIRKKERPSR